MRLPEGATIDVRNIDRWDFPAGTRFWKEFRFGGRKVETRFLRKNGDGSWTFASYAWNDDADRRDPGAGGRAAERGGDRARQVPQHSVGDRLPRVPRFRVRSASCPASQPATRFARKILGFSALQLSTDRDPGRAARGAAGRRDGDVADAGGRGACSNPRGRSWSPRRRASRRPTRARVRCSDICRRTAEAATTRTARSRISGWR